MHVHPPIVTAIAVGIVLGADRFAPQLSVFLPGQRIIGGAVAVAGIALVLWAIGHFRREGTTVLPDRLEERAADMTALITSGPFAFSRNPIYLGKALLVTGAGLGVGSLVAPFVLAAFVWFIQTRQIVPEEQVLARRFGPEYERYAAHVNRWLGRRRQRVDGTPA